MLHRTNKLGFTMIELLVVLVIVAILAAVAAPLYLANTKKSKATEAVATVSLIRQALRDYKINHNTYFTNVTLVAGANGGIIQNPLPTSVSGTTPSPLSAGLDVDAGAAQYFSNSAYTFTAESGRSFSAPTTGTGAVVSNPTTPVDFLIKVDGSKSENSGCSGYGTVTSGTLNSNCAIKKEEILAYRLEMDNSGRIFVSYDGGTTWAAY